MGYHIRFCMLSITILSLGACQQLPGFVTTDDASTGIDTSAPTSTGGDASTSSSTGEAETTTGDPTEDVVIDCGHPADECTPDARDWCDDMRVLCSDTVLSAAPGSGETDYCAVFETMCLNGTPPCQLCNYLVNTCKQLGGGGDCEPAAEDCLCRALAHNLPI